MLSLQKTSTLLFLLTILLSSCSSRNALMPTPHIYSGGTNHLFEDLQPELKTPAVEVLYVTDRLPERDELGNLQYSYGRSSSLAYGSATVEFGSDLNWDELVSISTRTTAKSVRPTVAVKAVEEFGRFPATPYSFHMEGAFGSFRVDPEVVVELENSLEKARTELLKRLSLSTRKEVFVFIHGINYTFNEAIELVAEGFHFLGREGVAVAYTWPAGSQGLFKYAYDRESGEFTIFHLKNFIKSLASIDEVEKIHFISHSRGTDVLTTALRELWIEVRNTTSDLIKVNKIGNVVMIAPDLDLEISMQRLVAEGLVTFADRITMYTNSQDDAIGAAKMVFSSILRLGAVNKETLSEQHIELVRQLKNFDIVTYFGDSGGSFGHSYFTSNPAVSSDIIALLRYQLAPGKENGRPLEHRGHGMFWRIDDDYFTSDM